MEKLAKFALRLTELMKEKEVNNVDIEKATGISNQALSNYRNCRREPHMINLEKLANYFECTVDYLIGRTDEY